MHRLWFKVWQQGQPIAPPIQVTSLPRGAQITGNIALRHSRGRVLAEAYTLAADAVQAQQIWEESRAVLPDQSAEQAPPAPTSQYSQPASQEDGRYTHAAKRSVAQKG